MQEYANQLSTEDKMTNQSLFIYVSGPYSPPASEIDPIKREKIIDSNIRTADEKAQEIVKLGHIPFVPHTMMRGWEDLYKIPREQVLYISRKWVEKCDALLFIAPSAGANYEKQIAEELGIRIFYKLEDIPKV